MRAHTTRALAVALLLLVASPLRANESELEDEPPPKSVDERPAPMRKAFRRAVRGQPLSPRLRSKLSGLPRFFRDSRLDLHTRSYYFHRRNLDGSRAEAGTVGGWLGYQSGWWKDTVALEWKLMTSQRLHAPDSRSGSLLLRSVQRGYTAGAAVANVKLRRGDTELVAYRQELGLPFVNKNDSRMTPNTFEGVVATSRIGNFRLIGGQLFKIKLRNEDHFISMSEAAGVPGTSSKGMTLAGVQWEPSESFSIGAIDYWVRDTFNTFYSETSWAFDLPAGVRGKLEGQITDQRSVGKELLPVGDFDTRRFASRFSLSYRNAILNLAFSTTDSDRRISNPYGSNPSYLSLMQRDFDRAGEDAFLVGISYNFARLDWPELSATLNFAHGRGARDEDGSLPDQAETNLTLDYRIGEGRLRGFWLRLRGSVLDQDGEDRTRNEFRAILNYEIPIY